MVNYTWITNPIDKHSFINGIKHSWPVCIAFFCMYGALGIMGASHNISLTQSTAMTLTMFAVPLQTFLTYNQELSVMSVLLNTLIINFRFMLMSVVLLTIWKKPKILSVLSLHFLCSSTYLVSIAEKKDENNWSFYLGLALISYLVAISSTILGYLIYQINYSDLRAFLAAIATIVLPIHFTCLTIKRKENKMVLIVTLMGLIIAPIAISLIEKNYLTLIFIIISYLMVLVEDKLCGKQLQ